VFVLSVAPMLVEMMMRSTSIAVAGAMAMVVAVQGIQTPILKGGHVHNSAICPWTRMWLN